ncbi:flagellar biosynthesis anti-sigma factor FlgM [Heyndrickxia sp. NPDC080065]|uniref:flagellar biosynthesis anti-sigma factor FlgM n=1 Tax=Heyndrickxia sp. NPDC080065 TaxID=3390568 RepID=UPI003CFF41D4
MKINNYGSSRINPYNQQKNQLNQIANQNKKNIDKVEISGAAKEMLQGSSIEKERQAKIEQLKNQIENGQYKPDPKQTAESIMKFYSGK